MALCYLDMTFCKSSCGNSECHRFISEEIVKKADAIGLPLAMSDFSSGCPDYRFDPEIEPFIPYQD